MRFRTLGVALLGALTGCSLVLGLNGDPEVSGSPDGDGGVSTLCGNDTRDEGEVCDDGNTASGDGCRGDCKGVEICGDDLNDFGEECDDGNRIPGDGCRANCTVEECGDGIADPGEICFGVRQTLTHEITLDQPGPDEVANFQPVAADVDGDSNLDIALVSSGENSGAALVYFAGDGSGSLGEPVEQPDESLGKTHLVLADLDGTQGLDAYTLTRSGSLYRFQNDGAGVFSAAVQTALKGAGFINGIAAGEMTGDSNPDLALIRHNPELETGSLYLLAGDGSLDPTDVGNAPKRLLVADLNNDARDDVAILGSAGGASSELRILLATGGGALSPQLPIPLPDGSQDLAAGDLDGDGDTDLVVSSQNAGPVVLRNNLGGGFEKTSLAAGINTSAVIALGDFDGDSDLDLIGLAFDSLGGLTSYANDGNGVFTLNSSWRLEGDGGNGGTSGMKFFYAIEAADLDGNGVDEPIVAWGSPMEIPSIPKNKSNIYILECVD